MKLANVIVIALGALLIIGTSNEGFVKVARKFGSIFRPFATGSLAMDGVLNEKDKNRIAKIWLIGLGSFVIIGAILAAIL